MRKKWFWKYALPAMLAIALPMNAIAQTTHTLTDDDGTISVGYGTKGGDGTWDPDGDATLGDHIHIDGDYELTVMGTVTVDTYFGNITVGNMGEGTLVIDYDGSASMRIGNVGTIDKHIKSIELIQTGDEGTRLTVGNIFANQVLVTEDNAAYITINGIGSIGMLELEAGDSDITVLDMNGSGALRVEGLKTGTDSSLVISGMTIALNVGNTNNDIALESITFKNGAKLQIWNLEAGTTLDDLKGFLSEESATPVIQNLTKWVDFNSAGVAVDLNGGNVNLSDGFVAAMTIHNRYAAWNAVRDRMISGSAVSGNGYRGQAWCDPCAPAGPCDEVCNPCDPCGTFGGNGSLARNAWVNYIGRGDSYRSSFADGNDWKLTMNGVQVGTDLFRSNRSQFGVLFAYEGGKMVNERNVLDRDQINVDDIYLGIYGVQVLRNGIDIRGSFAYGWQDYGMSRFEMVDGSNYTSAFKGYTTETNIEIGRRMGRGPWSLRPVVGLDVFTNNLKAAVESDDLGGLEAMAYNKTSRTQTFFRTGTELRWQVRRATFNTGLFYAYDMNGKELKAGVADAPGGAGNAGWLVGSKPERSLLTLNVGGELKLGKNQNFVVFGGYQGQYALGGDTKSAMNAGHVGGGWRW